MDAGFNTLKTLAYLQNSNETGNTLSSADGSRCALWAVVEACVSFDRFWP